jgi:hypothetical protein
MTDQEIKEYIKDAVELALSRYDKNRVDCQCKLEDLGVDVKTHYEHHTSLSGIIANFKTVRTAFLVGVVTSVTGGLLTLLWFAIKNIDKVPK